MMKYVMAILMLIILAVGCTLSGNTVVTQPPIPVVSDNTGTTATTAILNSDNESISTTQTQISLNKQLSFDSITYKNNAYSFSIQHPKDWLIYDNPPYVYMAALPWRQQNLSLLIYDTDRMQQERDARWKISGCSNITESGPVEVTLNDGKTKGQFRINRRDCQGISYKTLGLFVDLPNNKTVMAACTSYEGEQFYNSELYKEILMTFTTKMSLPSELQTSSTIENQSTMVRPAVAQSSDNQTNKVVNLPSLTQDTDIVDSTLKSTVLIFSTDELEMDKAITTFWDSIEILKPIVSQQKVVNYAEVQRTSWLQGSGVIIDRRGYILTTRSVIENEYGGGAQLMHVFLYEGDGLIIAPGREYIATVICKHPHDDLAIIKITPRYGDLPYSLFGDSDLVKTGQTAMALGYPDGLLHLGALYSYKWKTGEIVFKCDPTSTSGSISAKRKFDTYPPNSSMEDQAADYTVNVFQTDCEINPGNSGGPLIDQTGKVIGIITSKLAYRAGLGFAVAINEAKDLIKAAMARRIDYVEDGTFLSCDDKGYCCSQSAWGKSPLRRCNQLCDEKYRASAANKECFQRCTDNTR